MSDIKKKTIVRLQMKKKREKNNQQKNNNHKNPKQKHISFNELWHEDHKSHIIIVSISIGMETKLTFYFKI